MNTPLDNRGDRLDGVEAASDPISLREVDVENWRACDELVARRSL